MSHPLVNPKGEWMRDVMSDAQVVARVQAGETALFELLLRRHNQRLFRTVRSIVQDDDEAQEVLQLTYVKAWRALATFEGRAQFITWVTRIATRTAHALRRSRQRREEVEHEAASESARAHPPAAEPDAGLEEQELAKWLEQLIDLLPEPQRLAFVLHVVQGVPADEVAEALEISSEAVRVRVHRARERLKVQFLERAEAQGLHAQVWAFDGTRCDRIVAAVFKEIRSL